MLVFKHWPKQTLSSRRAYGILAWVRHFVGILRWYCQLGWGTFRKGNGAFWVWPVGSSMWLTSVQLLKYGLHLCFRLKTRHGFTHTHQLRHCVPVVHEFIQTYDYRLARRHSPTSLGNAHSCHPETTRTNAYGCQPSGILPELHTWSWGFRFRRPRKILGWSQCPGKRYQNTRARLPSRRFGRQFQLLELAEICRNGKGFDAKV